MLSSFDEKPSEMEKFDRAAFKQKIEQTYRCAGCWCDIKIIFDDERDVIYYTCPIEDCYRPGLLTVACVERRISELNVKAINAQHILRKAIAWLDTKVSVEENLQALGF